MVLCMGGYWYDRDCGSAPPPKNGVSVFFAYDSAKLTPLAREILRMVPKDREVRIVGHASPEGSDEYNLRLGQRRAFSVKSFLGRGKVESVGERECKEERRRWHVCRKANIWWR